MQENTWSDSTIEYYCFLDSIISDSNGHSTKQGDYATGRTFNLSWKPIKRFKRVVNCHHAACHVVKRRIHTNASSKYLYYSNVLLLNHTIIVNANVCMRVCFCYSFTLKGLDEFECSKWKYNYVCPNRDLSISGTQKLFFIVVFSRDWH